MQNSINQNFYPPEIMPWLATSEFNNRIEQLFVKHGFDEGSRDAFYGFIRSILTKEVSLQSLAQVARTSLFLGNEESKLFARDLIGLLILPMVIIYEDDDPIALLESFGGQISEYPLPINIEKIQKEMAEILDDMYYRRRVDFLEKELEEEKINSNRTESELQTANQEVNIVAREGLQQKLAEQYQQLHTTGMQQAENRLQAVFTNNHEEFVKTFYQAINDRKNDDVIAALWVMATHGKLQTVLADDARIRQKLASHLTKKYSENVAVHLETNPTDAPYIAYFLRHLLFDTLKMTEHEAGALVIHLVNEQSRAAGVDMEILAYGDLEKESFVWRDIKEQNGALVLD